MRNSYLAFVLLLVVSICSFPVGNVYAGKALSESTFLISGDTIGVSFKEIIDADLLAEVVVTAYLNHVNSPNFDGKKISKGMARGFMQSLDKHSNFLDPEEAANWEEISSGKLNGGIGIAYTVKKRSLVVNEVAKGSPAEKAGLKAKDRIIAVNGVSIRNIQVSDVVKMIRGEIGTKVILRIIRKEEKDPIDISVTRDAIVMETVRCKLVRKFNKKFGIVRITGFRENTYAQFVLEASNLMKLKPDHIILDLRDNSGGRLDSVRNIMSRIVGPGEVLFQEQTLGGRIEKAYSLPLATDKIFSYKGSSVKKITCLINEGTASAAEIMSSGLRDALGIKLIGETTYGKGTGWVPIKLKSGKGTCNVTCLKWFTPKGQSIDEVGIDPDIEVFMDEEDIFLKKDPQMDAALEELLKK